MYPFPGNLFAHLQHNYPFYIRGNFYKHSLVILPVIAVYLAYVSAVTYLLGVGGGDMTYVGRGGVGASYQSAEIIEAVLRCGIPAKGQSPGT